MRRYGFQPNHRSDQQHYKKQAPKITWLPKKHHADHYRPHRSDSGPDGISGTKRNILGCFVQKIEAEHSAHQEAGGPAEVPEIVGQFQAGSKTNFEKTGKDEDDPGHDKEAVDGLPVLNPRRRQIVFLLNEMCRIVNQTQPTNAMSVTVVTTPKKRRKPGIPAYLIYETLNNRPLYRRGYRDVLAGKKKPAEITGTSSIQAMLVSLIHGFLFMNINRKRYLLVTNESGVHLDKGTNLSNDIAIFDKLKGLTLTNKYFDTPPKIAIEVDVNIEPGEFVGKEAGYVHEKTQQLLDFGVEQVIWITTQPRKVFVATPSTPWTTQNWDATVPVLDDVELNLAGLLAEEGIEF